MKTTYIVPPFIRGTVFWAVYVVYFEPVGNQVSKACMNDVGLVRIGCSVVSTLSK